MSKLELLKELEKKYESTILSKESKIDETKQKYFITFPYPYMNGRLHLGHGYSIMNAEMNARFWQSKGLNVMFPFAFHGSGMPIVACAKKLQRELESFDDTLYNECSKESQIGILRDMGIKIDEIDNFIDPEFWIKYFSEKAKIDLTEFQICADFSRSFYTTHLNPYYDAFIKWQFSHLIKDGFVYKGVRNVIYSMRDGQPCADHDRHIGEGVKPIDIKCICITNAHIDSNILTTVCTNNQDDMLTKLYMAKTDYVYFKTNNQTCLTSKFSYDNIRHQYDNVNMDNKDVKIYTYQYIIDTFFYTKLFKLIDDPKFGTGFYLSDSEDVKRPVEEIKYSSFIYSEPDGLVISRSDDNLDRCIVATTHQWFINYDNEYLKEEVRDFVKNTFKTPDKHVHKMFESSVEWLSEWACSRNFGLGTFIPHTNDLIDSLSDSTIYMAFYTISHLVTQIKSEYFDIMYQPIFDYVFLEKDAIREFGLYNDIIQNMKKEFNYWYPLDMRVSGKDLINNHLTMALFNHQAIWRSQTMLPRSYQVNGHLLLNKEKMSKHTGNFMTLSDAISKFGVSATRLTLANNDGYEDGDFDFGFANSAILKLDSIKEFVDINMSKETYDSPDNNPYTMWDKIFDSEIYDYVKMSEKAYVDAKYKTVIFAFNGLIASRNEYNRYKNYNMKSELIKKYIEALITILYPICPSFVEYIKDKTKLNVNWNIENRFIDANKYKLLKQSLFNTISECFKGIEKFKKKGITDFTIEIIIFKKYGDLEIDVINNLNNLEKYLDGDKKKYGLIRGFSKFIESNIQKYGDDYLNIIINETEEIDIFREYIPKIITDYKIIITEGVYDDKTRFKNGPMYPIVNIKKIE